MKLRVFVFAQTSMQKEGLNGLGVSSVSTQVTLPQDSPKAATPSASTSTNSESSSSSNIALIAGGAGGGAGVMVLIGLVVGIVLRNRNKKVQWLCKMI